MEQVDAVVVGAGVVGLAVARALARQGLETLVLERETAIGQGVSSRNSEVIHAGLYYPPGSLKARLCVRGKQLLYEFCASHQVAHQRCGKLVVATDAGQLAGLHALQSKAAANGVHDLQWLGAAEARALEPQLRCEAALLSPSTGIVDSHGLMLALQGELERHGGAVGLASEVRAIAPAAQGQVLSVAMPQGEQMALQARLVAAVQETELLPPIADLPENMQAAEFRRRFGSTEAPAYQQMLREIEARLDRLPLLAPQP